VQVRFRLTPRQVVTQGLVVLFAWASMVFLNVRIGGANPVLLVAYGVAFALSVGLSGRWRGAELTPDGVIIRRNAKRFVPWSDVTDVRQGSVLLTRVVVFETPRGVVRSWAPAASPLAPDRDFDAKLTYIRQWWWGARPGAGGTEPLWPAANSTGWGVPVVTRSARPDSTGPDSNGPRSAAV
jgi:hypothetical protein